MRVAIDARSGRVVSDPAVLVALTERCGLNGPELLDAADNQAVREEYRGNTARALAAGVFGSPFYVFAGELFWGQDRLDMLEGAIVRAAPGNLGQGPG
jgi:2-hydroxychromene-2-carboxylate isomerase